MNHLVGQANLTGKIVCDSAGTCSYHVGSPPDKRMSAAARLRGIELRGRARQFEPADFDKFDLIVAMDRENYRDLLSLDPQGKYRARVRLMGEFATKNPFEDVPDPYYGGREGFARVIDLLFDTCSGLLERIKPQVIQ